MNEIERAIEQLDMQIKCMVNITSIKTCRLAISALEKQIPKEAEYHHKSDGDCALIICPNCESRLTVAKYIFPLDRYCKECGQHYTADVKDWSVEE